MLAAPHVDAKILAAHCCSSSLHSPVGYFGKKNARNVFFSAVDIPNTEFTTLVAPLDGALGDLGGLGANYVRCRRGILRAVSIGLVESNIPT